MILKLSKEQIKRISLSLSFSDIQEYIKSHHSEYEAFLKNETKNNNDKQYRNSKIGEFYEKKKTIH